MQLCFFQNRTAVVADRECAAQRVDTRLKMEVGYL